MPTEPRNNVPVIEGDKSSPLRRPARIDGNIAKTKSLAEGEQQYNAKLSDAFSVAVGVDIEPRVAPWAIIFVAFSDLGKE